MGSSVGVSKATDLEELVEALDLAFSYDRRVLVEAAVDGRELEVALLGGYVPEIGQVGEIITNSEYYDFSSKYEGEGSKLIIPAKLDGETIKNINSIARKAWQVLDGYGFARIDLFLKENGEILINEMNTIPGFTRFSMYPRLMTSKVFSYEALIERIIDLGYERCKTENKIG
jgi:D-alanine-D-alanine ligase